MIPWGAAVSRANIISPISTTRSRRSGIPCIGDTLPVRILFTGGTRPSPSRRGPLRSGWLFLGERPGKVGKRYLMYTGHMNAVRLRAGTVTCAGITGERPLPGVCGHCFELGLLADMS